MLAACALPRCSPSPACWRSRRLPKPTSSPRPRASPPGQSQSVATADFNRDGDRDIVVGNQAAASGVLMGGHGLSFGSPIPIPVGSSGLGVAVADFNGDADPDLAFASFPGLSVVTREDDGTFGTPQPVLATGGHHRPRRRRLNRDGDQDLPVASSLPDRVSVLLGTPTGFAPAVEYAAGATPEAIVAGDFDVDGRADLASANFDGGTLSVLLNAAEPAIETDPSGLNFGTQPQATISTPRTITVHSTGDRALRIQRLRRIGRAAGATASR